MSTETIVSSPSRRFFLQSTGATGLAIGAGALIAGCGGSDHNDNNSGGAHITPAAISTAFKSVQADENNHVQLLTAAITALGGTPRPAPTFTSPALTVPQTSFAAFVSLATALGNTETSAYVAAVPIAGLDTSTATIPVGSNSYTALEAAAAIAITEGRHAGFFNSLSLRPLLTDPTNGDTVEPSNQSREVPLGPDEVASRALPFTGTIGNDSSFGTNLNGGPALPTDATVAGASPVDIFNYALFLEYVGSTFYNLNVPAFFG